MNAKMTSHIVGMTSEGVEEESDEGKRRRFEKSQVADEVRPVGPAVEPAERMDQDVPEADIREKKRKSGEEPDDPRADGEGGAEVVHDTVDGTAESSGSRMATGDSPTISYRSDKNDDDMIGSLSINKCSHCRQRFSSRNLMFKHLYQVHDDDGEGAEKKRMTSLQTNMGLEEMGAPALTKIALPAQDEHAMRQRAKSKPNFAEA